METDSYQNRVSITFVLLCLFILTNFISPRMLVGIEYARIPFFIFVATVVFFVAGSIFNRRFLYIKNFALLFALVFVGLAYLISINCEYDPNNSEYMFKEFLIKSLAIFIFVSSLLTNVKEARLFSYVIVFGGAFLAYSLIINPEYIQGRPYSRYSTIVRNPNDMAMFLSYVLPFAITSINSNNHKIFRFICLLTIFYMTVALLETRSRGGFLAILTLYFLYIHRKKNLSKKALTVFLTLPIVFVFVVRYAPSNYLNRMKEIVHNEEDSTGSAQARSKIIGITFNYMVTHPLSEYGLGNNGYLVADDQMVIEYSESVFKGSHVHNIFLQVGADLGAFPMIIYILFVLSIFLAIRNTKKNVLERGHGRSIHGQTLLELNETVKIAMIVLLVSSMFLPIAYRFHIFLLGGYCLALQRVSGELQILKTESNFG